jgi:DNA repair photolyase
MNLSFDVYQPRKIVNIHKHVDGPWFWNRYSAHPYVGCRSGCEFCYLRGGRYLGKRDPLTFDTLIQVKSNAADLLRRELSRLTPDVITLGDWQQPAEDRYRLSRAMLEVALELGFPVLVIERSPLLLRDADLLAEIQKKSWVCVVWSFSNLDPALKRAFEPRSPGLARRLQAMERLAAQGILVGASLMPILPFAGDDKAHLEEAVVATRDHGGAFVLAGGLSMAGVQAERGLAAAARLDSSLVPHWRQMYRWQEGEAPGDGPPPDYAARLGSMVRELCSTHGLRDRIPRFLGTGPRSANRRIAERLFLRTYDLELMRAEPYRIWAYRRAAWTVDEWPKDLASAYERLGDKALKELPGIGSSLAAEIGGWLRARAPSSDWADGREGLQAAGTAGSNASSTWRA